jgi:hypothetical protein
MSVKRSGFILLKAVAPMPRESPTTKHQRHIQQKSLIKGIHFKRLSGVKNPLHAAMRNKNASIAKIATSTLMFLN